MLQNVSIPLIRQAALTLVAVWFAHEGLQAGNPVMGQLSGSILTAGDRHLIVLSSAGDTLWQYPTKLTHDAWMLPNGNVLFADGESVTEVTREKKVVFQYRPVGQNGGGAYACQRLANGMTLVGENSTGRILEIDAAGKISFALQTDPFKPGDHQNLRMARKLANGHYLVCHSGARLVKEYDASGKVTWQAKVPGPLAFAAVRTPEGTTLVSSLDQVTEFDAGGSAIWACAVAELSGANVRNLTGIHLLPNGNIVAGCYRAYQDGRGSALLEFSRDKKVVWRYSNPSGDGTMMPVQKLTGDGTAFPGPSLR